MADVVGVGALAQALNRSPSMIKRLEEQGAIPLCPYRRRRRPERSRPEHFGQRLYTVEMVEQAAAVARACGVLDHAPGNWKDTGFTERLRAAWYPSTAD